MTDRPILFSAPMILALLDDRKTQTRRLAWKAPKHYPGVPCEHGFDLCPECDKPRPTIWQKVKPRDRLWVRENLQRFDKPPITAQYAATIEGVPAPLGAPRSLGGAALWNYRHAIMPAIHMPRIYSRITQVVTAVRMEPVQDISDEDCLAEGVCREWGIAGQDYDIDGDWWPGGPRRVFKGRWEALHGPESWASNPDVVALTFTVHKANIDALKEAA